jgi:hypothetical protein
MVGESGRTYRTMGKKAQTRRTRIIRLHVIPEPKKGTRSVLLYSGEGTQMITTPNGPGIKLVCGKCDAPLAGGVPVSKIQGMVLRCNKCGSFNETPA